ncbi:hypothetical protein PAHAL_9G556400 [Panicum hallii]|jgi:hypothetical protein|uniref:Uncharacterized protein n=1 Tax=Panicum hallii TaxID=206008 RepID=A0A2S3IT39_9POAL|nr:hypothetical protein PAHAL_9G556400 [Panicum hallii]
MFPDDGVKPLPRGAAGRAATRTIGGRGRGEHPRSAERDGGGLAVVAVGGQRGTLYDSFELNAMVARLNRLLNANGDGAGGSGSGSGGAGRPRKAAGSWLAAPKVLFRRIKGAFLGGRRGDG